MAPTRGSSKGASSGGASKGPKGPKGSKPSGMSSSSRVSKPSSKKNVKRPPPQEVKSKARTAPENLARKKKRVYTEAELDLPKLNQITPVGVVKPKGKKKGKVFVDDQEGMMTILAMVNAEKEGQIESKMMKARQLEEIREAKKAEAEARMKEKKSKLDAVKDTIRNKKKNKGGNDRAAESSPASSKSGSKSAKGKRKSVSFA
ncbi:60S ribosomal subunit assembly/export protein loc1 [Penicillium subrubescens]|uniref:60S ribosomal subunit assembly/export protein LOC1 n=1 Tax=Penicillium subrubescens TaxID=1316194 RepID=A0A1Q5TE06_9EURO|nr:60S ribosomal subunit assembly/export protein loc1 [Penicillium subrubescens]KAJ5873480.1 60S ribosomal subunit assembly/export protein loc1 [Penicillium subrubescens]OKO98450.1 60S ribosomal subunit assembly/export protein LOC1 [Penicillium subrubescens]